jgi:hypothetical protein
MVLALGAQVPQADKCFQRFEHQEITPQPLPRDHCGRRLGP